MDEAELKKTIKLEVREYFDHFLEVTYPLMLKNHMGLCPHGKAVSKLRWTLVGAAAVIMVLLPVFGKSLLTLIK